MSGTTTLSTPLRQRLNVIMARWSRLIGMARAPYRPELHYMRGPGPKWHARHQGAAAKPARGIRPEWRRLVPPLHPMHDSLSPLRAGPTSRAAKALDARQPDFDTTPALTRD